MKEHCPCWKSSVKLCCLVISFYHGDTEVRRVFIGLSNSDVSLLGGIYISDFMGVSSMSCVDGLISLGTFVGSGTAKLNQSQSCFFRSFLYLLLML